MPKHDTQDVWYETHPVTPERKALIRSFGLRIVDAIFKPDDYQNPEVDGLDASNGQGSNPDANGDGKVTAAELKEALTAKGIAFRGNASKADLQALLDASNGQGS